MINQDEIKIVELTKDDAHLTELKSKYSTSTYYDLSVWREPGGWKMELSMKSLEETVERNYKGRLFEDHVEEPRVFVAVLNDKQVGWIELGYDRWNNRMRVWEFLVEEAHRGKGIGTLLMKQALKVSKEKGARMLVLETQTCNVPAISFYLRFGFELVGFDIAAYSNEDVGRKEVRLELGLKL